MLIRKRALLGLSVAALAGAVLLLAWYVRREPERRLINERQRMIDEATRSPTGVSPTRGLATPYRIETKTEAGQPSEIRYYRENELIAVDIIDDRGKVVRRDFLDGTSVRAQLFYDSDGRLVATKFYDDQGRARTTTPLLPVPPFRTGY